MKRKRDVRISIKLMILAGIGTLLSTLIQRLVTEYKNDQTMKRMLMDTKEEYKRYLKKKK